MGAHGAQVGWKFFEKFFLIKCLMDINKGKITLPFQY